MNINKGSDIIGENELRNIKLVDDIIPNEVGHNSFIGLLQSFCRNSLGVAFDYSYDSYGDLKKVG